MSDRTPSKLNSSLTDFSIADICSSAKKPSNNGLYGGTEKSYANPTSAPSFNYTSGYSGDLLQGRIDHLERERYDLGLQLHKREEKDRERKVKLEQIENRLKFSEDERIKLTSELSSSRETITRMRFETDEMKIQIEKLTNEIASTTRLEAMDIWQKMSTVNRELRRVEEEKEVLNNEKNILTEENQILSITIRTLTEERDSFQKKTQRLFEEKQLIYDQLEKYKTESKSVMEQNEANWKSQKSELCEEIEMLKQIINDKEETYCELETKFNDYILKSTNQSSEDSKDSPEFLASGELKQFIQELKDKLQESEEKRRKLHNQVQDLRGNIRVFVRCRPFLPSDGEEAFQTKQSQLLFHEDKTSLSLLNHTNQKPLHQFMFDQIFDSSTTQDKIYEEVSGLVQSVIDGYRVCVFSYGQTGSGKTHTMTGEKNGPARGVIPRAIEEVLQQSQTLLKSGWEISLNLSIVEIYNEDLRDLLVNSKAAINQSNNTSNDKNNKFKITKQGNKVVVNGLTTVTLNTIDYNQGLKDFYQFLDLSMQNRATASTGMNEVSSRSHLIVMLDVNGTYQVTSKSGEGNGIGQKIQVQGGLRLCDLAGSERLDRTNTLNDATRLKETVNINKSLSCLADVFLALSNKAPHIPYRNSKLTMLLQDCLSGEGKSMMFVNISPTVASTQETLCSLRFANQVSQVEMGKAQKNLITTTIIPSSVPETSPLTVAPVANVSSAAPTTKPFNRRSSLTSSRQSILPPPPQQPQVMQNNQPIPPIPPKNNQLPVIEEKDNEDQEMSNIEDTNESLNNSIVVETVKPIQTSAIKTLTDTKVVRFHSFEDKNNEEEKESMKEKESFNVGRPVAMFSFLSGQAERTAKPLNRSNLVGASRRTSVSVAPGSSFLMSSSSSSAPSSFLMSSSRKGFDISSAIVNANGCKENDSNSSNILTSSINLNGPASSKREYSFLSTDNTSISSKRVRVSEFVSNTTTNTFLSSTSTASSKKTWR